MKLYTVDKSLIEKSPAGFIYMLGTKLFSIYKGEANTTTTCPVCKGKGDIYFSEVDQYFSCPNCSGIGKIYGKNVKGWFIYTDHLSNLPIAREVTSIHIEKDGNKKKPKICYYFQCNGYYAENVFPTLEEAKAEVARRNKLLKTEQKEEK